MAPVVVVASIVVTAVACASPTEPESEQAPEALTVLERTPAPGSDNVYSDDPIEITFSAAVDATTLSSDSVILSTTGAIPLARTLELSPDGTRLRVRTPSRPAVPATLTLTLTSGIRSVGGAALEPPATPHHWSLPAWHRLLDVGDETIGHLARGAAVALTPDGTVFAATIAGEQFGDAALTVAAWSGAVWEHLEHPVGPVVLHGGPSLAAGDDGTLFVAAVVPSSPWRHVEVWARDVTGGWQPLEGQLGTEATRPWLALQPDGAPVVAWHDTGGGTVVGTRAARWTGSEWLMLDSFVRWPEGSTTSAGSTGARTAVDSTGRVIVSRALQPQVDMEPQSYAVVVSEWNGDAWTTVGTFAGHGTNGGVVIGEDDHPVVAYLAGDVDDPEARQVRLVRWTGATWSPVGGPVGTLGTIERQPGLVADPLGRLVVAWREVHADGAAVHVARFEGGVWHALGGPLAAVPGLPYWDVADAHLAIDGAGQPIIVYQGVDPAGDSTARVRVARWNGP
jgi:hypothetical protein